VHDQFSDRPVDQFTKEYFDGLLRFLEDPYPYSSAEVTGDKPGCFKGVTGSKPSDEYDKERDS
jgi:hypothetical protein